MLSVGIYVGGSVYYGTIGVVYSLPPKIVFSSDMNISFEFLKRMIYQQLGLLEHQCTLNIHAKINTGDQNNIFFSLVPIIDNPRLSKIIEQITSCPFQSMLELFVDVIPNISSNAYIPTCDNLPGSSTQPNWNAPPYQSQNIPEYQSSQFDWNAPQYPPQNIPQYQDQPINPYYQTNWNVPKYPPQNMPHYQSETNYNYVSEPQHNIPDKHIHQHGENMTIDTRNDEFENPIRVRSVSEPSKDDEFFNNDIEPADDTDAEEEVAMEAENDETSSSSDDDNPASPPTHTGGQSHMEVPFPFVDRGRMHPVDTFNQCATEEIQADSYTYGQKQMYGGPLDVGQTFASKAELDSTVKQYHIDQNRQCKSVNTSKKKYIVRCENELCNWRLYAVCTDGASFEIRTNPFEHSCHADVARQDHRQLTASFIANHLLKSVKRNPGISMRDLRSVVESKFDQQPTYNKLWRAKEKAIARVWGGWKEAYALLPRVLSAYRRLNPGTEIVIEGDPLSETEYLFKRAAWSFGPVRDALKHVRPVFGIDATFLTGRYKQKLLVATAYDANNQLLPFAYGLVDEEDNESWGWWMEWLRRSVIANNKPYTIISDRHISIRNVFMRTDKGWCEARSEAKHRYCTRHIMDNIHKKFNRDKIVVKHFKAAARAKKMRKHEDAMKALHAYNRRAWDYVVDIGKTGSVEEKKKQPPRPDLWALGFDGGTNRLGIMTTNGPESLNKVYKDARALPLTAVVEATFHKTMTWFADRRELARENMEAGNLWAPYVAEKIERRTRKSHSMVVDRVHRQMHMFQVTAREGKEGHQATFKYKCQLFPPDRSTCECHKPDLTGIPCSHVIAALATRSLNISNFVSPYYSAESLFRTWEPLLIPEGGKESWPECPGPKVIPDPTKIKKGRRKHHRIPMSMDDMERQRKRNYRCSKCGGVGHAINRCRAPPAPQETEEPRRHSFSGVTYQSTRGQTSRPSVSGVPRPTNLPTRGEAGQSSIGGKSKKGGGKIKRFLQRIRLS